MRKLLSISAVIGVMAVAVLTSMFALGLVNSEQTQETLFKVILVIGIYTIASVFILLIVGIDKKDVMTEVKSQENKNEEKN